MIYKKNIQKYIEICYNKKNCDILYRKEKNNDKKTYAGFCGMSVDCSVFSYRRGCIRN